jgi:hypothetical protein
MAFDRARAIGLAQKVLRAAQAVVAVLVIACAAKSISFNSSNDYWKFGSGSAGFMIFVSVASMLAAVFFLAVSWMEQLHQKVAGAVDAGVSGVLVVLWLAASVRFVRVTTFCGNEGNWAASAGYYYGYDEAVKVLKDYCAVRSAAVAFGFLAWLLWLASTALAVVELRARRALRSAGPTPGATQMTEGEQGCACNHICHRTCGFPMPMVVGRRSTRRKRLLTLTGTCLAGAGGQVKSVATPGMEDTPQQQVIYVQQPGAVVRYNQQPAMQSPVARYTTPQRPMETPGPQYTQQAPIQPSTRAEV